MMSNDLYTDYKLASVHIIESVTENSKSRGTCFAITDEHLITAAHVIKKDSINYCYLKSDDYVRQRKLQLEVLAIYDELDIAVLKTSGYELLEYIAVCELELKISQEVKSCGYPLEKAQNHEPFNSSISNITSMVETNKFSFSLHQADNITNYKGMSGAPLLYNGCVIGVLLVQHGGNSLYAVSFSDIFKKLDYFKNEYKLKIVSNEEVHYVPRTHPESPLKTIITDSFLHPHIRGLDIGFDYNEWRSDKLVELAVEWLVDYSLSASQRKAYDLKPKPFKMIREALRQFNRSDINAMADLLLHIAIRKSCKTIPVVNEITTIRKKSIFSCSHIVLNNGSFEIWLGVSAIEKTVRDAVKSVVGILDKVINVSHIDKRLLLINEKTDTTWPFQERIEKLGNNTLSIEERVDRIVIPVFISHNCDVISNYDEATFLERFKIEVLACKDEFQQQYPNGRFDKVNIKIFHFPVNDIDELFQVFVTELDECI
ncbi:Hachiman antiphage defense system protein HamA [Photobacterium damselae subsp. damselae]|uniref:Hachiman antiphage defense system protein HamA n=1 Tax=Photobacterium damselae TaxID=38293 RepID=UPI00083AF59E|nr:Hachiman antiphage defense system protein HamA [Photobacterium damselae]QSH56386.1 DUF1837 domain-containing protein [Photobacterium damselae subsp. damselae]